MLLFIILSTLLTYTCALVVGQRDPPSPSFCNGLDCPHFSVIQTFKEGYELRKYEQTKWVATNVTTIEYTNATNREMFFRLFYYISGNNTAHQKIPMTAPVLKTVIHSQGPACESTFVSHFMVPHNMMTNTPEPTDPKAYLVYTPEMRAYVKSFGGRPTELDYVEKAQELAEAIGDPTKYEDSYYFMAGYDGPYTLHRHNEVWLKAK